MIYSFLKLALLPYHFQIVPETFIILILFIDSLNQLMSHLQLVPEKSTRSVNGRANRSVRR